MDRRRFVSGALLATVAGAIGAVLPEFKALAAMRAPQPDASWEVELIASDRLVDVTSDLAPDEVSSLFGFVPKYVTAALGTLRDGTRVRRIGAMQDDENTSVVLQHLPKAGDEILGSLVLRYLGTRESGVRLVSGGPTVGSQMPPTTMSGCPCNCCSAVCTGVDGAFFDCCAPCVFAGPAIIACALIWCQICLIEHCNRYQWVCNC